MASRALLISSASVPLATLMTCRTCFASRTFSALSAREIPSPSPRSYPLSHSSRRPMSLATAADSFRDLYLGCLTSTPVTSAATALSSVHDSTGLPWWAVVGCATAALRGALLFPAHVTAQKTIVKRATLYKQFDEQLIPFLRAKVREQQLARGMSDREARARFDRLRQALYKDKVVEYNCAATKMYVPFLLQIPLWVSMSMAIRRLAGILEGRYQMADDMARTAEMSAEGCLWFPDLVIPDHTLVLPFLLGSLYLANVAVHANNHSPDSERPRSAKLWTAGFTCVSLIMIPISTMVPSALALYWTISAGTGLAVTLAVMSPRIRNLCRIPLVQGESDHPYTRVISNARDKSMKISRRLF